MSQFIELPRKQFHMILQGDVRKMLKKLPDESVDCVVTSPPYWSLRDYKIDPVIWDGIEGCEHDFSIKNKGVLKESTFSETSILNDSAFYPKLREINIGNGESFFCSKCGAWKGQLGLEPTYQLYVKHIVDIFHEVKRVLKSTGALWLNLGDTYSGSENDLPQKCLIGIPERIMLAMIDDGWILRNKIVWFKVNHIPSSSKDRFSNGWEIVYFFVKKEKYWFDGDAVRVPYSKSGIERMKHPLPLASNLGKEASWVDGKLNKERTIVSPNPKGKIPDDVWLIAIGSTREFHFAAFPEELVERPIKATCPPDGVVLDPFAGSGTTASVAKRLRRSSISIEIKPEFVDIIKRRIDFGHTTIDNGIEWIEIHD